jgi:hypothetical protein
MVRVQSGFVRVYPAQRQGGRARVIPVFYRVPCYVAWFRWNAASRRAVRGAKGSG